MSIAHQTSASVSVLALPALPCLVAVLDPLDAETVGPVGPAAGAVRVLSPRAATLVHVAGGPVLLLAPGAHLTVPLALGRQLGVLSARPPLVADVAGPPGDGAGHRAPSLWSSADHAVRSLIGYLGDPALQEGAAARGAGLLTELLVPLDPRELELPRPADGLVSRVVEEIWASPAGAHDAEAVAARHRMSPRSLARVSQRSFGLSYVALRARVRLHRSAYEIARGRSVSAVAATVGYRSAASYGAAFRAATGLSPGSFAGSFAAE